MILYYTLLSTPHRVSLLYSRILRIPNHISILYVEQEVTGNETIALDSVLECDTVRASLLAQEKQIQARIAQG